ncbi:MAG: peptidyl-prolyl cis-trans isomerase, partial [Bacteroides sp.]|nr:peptidyl-prolyl cis-trans isomerase [Bacteroides sp.]
EGYPLFSVKDMLEQFIALQLQVVAAEEAGIHRNPVIIANMEQYRNYLTDLSFLRNEKLEEVQAEKRTIYIYIVEYLFYPVTQYVGNLEENRITQELDSLYQLCITHKGKLEEVLPFSEKYEIISHPMWENERMEEIEQVVSGLIEGELSKPFRTAAGWYMIRLLYKGEEQPFPTGLPRYNDLSVTELVEQIKKEYNYKENKEVLATLRAGKKRSGIIFTLNDYAVHTEQFLDFAQHYPGGFRKQYEAFVTKILIRHRYEQVISQDDSWSKKFNLYYKELLAACAAAEWSMEQQSDPEKNFETYKAKNRRKYAAPEPAFQGIIVESVSKSLFRHIKKITKKNPVENWEKLIDEQFNRDEVQLVRISSGEFAKGENRYTDHFIFKTSALPLPQKKYPHIKVFGKKIMREPIAIERSEEKMWEDYRKELNTLQEEVLRSRYKVQLFEDVLKTVNYN